jgi:fumarate reductase subunit D
MPGPEALVIGWLAIGGIVVLLAVVGTLSAYGVAIVIAAAAIAEALARLPRFARIKWLLGYVGFALLVFGALNPLLQLDSVSGHEQVVRLVLAWIGACILYVLFAKALEWDSNRLAAKSEAGKL